MNGTLMCDAELVILEFDGLTRAKFNAGPTHFSQVCILDTPTPPDE
ncbi:hypothetical protein J5X84_25465 [Streptosporangiaceae bacterium NEAU-GS5]|nr:hypothetical protein [Streptosporangiaceae bacterium NEAU-GS5]